MPSGYCSCGYFVHGPAVQDVDAVMAKHNQDAHGAPRPAAAAEPAPRVQPKAGITDGPGAAPKDESVEKR